MRRVGVLGCTAIVLAVAAAPAPAHACGPGGWGAPGEVAPAHGTLVPANLPAIIVSPCWKSTGVCAVGDVQLTDTSKQPIPLTPSPGDAAVLLLAQPLIPGSSYSLTHDGAPAGQFSATESSPLPTSTGALKIIASGHGPVGYAEYSCSWTSTAAWVRLQLTPACDLVPYLPVTRFSARIGGEAHDWAKSKFGSLQAATNLSHTTKTVDLVWGSCDTTLSYVVQAHLPGASTQPAPASIQLSLDCPGDAATGTSPEPGPGTLNLAGACSTPDAGASADADAGSGADAGVDGGEVPSDGRGEAPPDPRDGAFTPRDPRDAGSGLEAPGGEWACRASRRPGSSGLSIWLLALGMASLRRLPRSVRSAGVTVARRAPGGTCARVLERLPK